MARRKIVAVGASSKKAGKSTLASMLVRELRADCALKASSGGFHRPPSPIVTDPAIVSEPGTDTGMLVEAGARKVVWVSADEEEMERELKRALDLFPPGVLIIAEGNSVVLALDPDCSIFLVNSPLKTSKPSAGAALTRADLVLLDLSREPGEPDREALEREIRALSPRAVLLSYTGDRERERVWSEVVRTVREKLKSSP